MLDGFMEAFADAGCHFWPLPNLTVLAVFLVAAGTFAVGTPGRAALVAQRLGATLQDTANLLDRLPQPLVDLVSGLPAQDGMTIVTDRVQCVACGERLIVTQPIARRDDVGRLSYKYQSSPVVYSTRGVLKATMHQKHCPGCGAVHFLSYACKGSVIPEGKQLFYPGCTDARFFHVTPHAVVETSLLVDYEAQALWAHTGFLTFMQQYRMKHGALHRSLGRARQWFAHIFFAWTLLRFEAELSLETGYIAVGSETSLDHTLLGRHERLDAAFTKMWGADHDTVCRTPGACVAHMLDGHMKARRKCCANKFARLVERGSLGSRAVNCSRDPMLGSRFCSECRDACAVGGPSAMVGAGGSSVLYVPAGAEADDHVRALAAARKEQERAEQAKARGWEAEQREKNVHLVEALLAKRPATNNGCSCNLGADHWKCVQQKRKMYLVKWANCGEESNSWVCERNVGKAAIKAYEDDKKQKAAGRRKHKGELAAAIAAKVSGDFKLTEEAERSFEEISCDTLKEFQYAEKKLTTAGILALVASCGLILKVKEIYGAESLTQCLDFFYEGYYLNGIKRPEVIVYDDACHLKKFLQLRVAVSWFVRWLLQLPGKAGKVLQICCDFFHFGNHKSAWCKQNVDPAKCTVLGKTNTQAAEQCFAWLAGAKKQFRHMKEATFFFYMLRLCHLRNVQLCKAGVAGWVGEGEEGGEQEQVLCKPCEGEGESEGEGEGEGEGE